MTTVKIAPTKAEKIEKKEWAKKVETLSAESTPHVEKGYVSKRDEDLFIGGPLDGYCCKHQPNGPEESWDPGGYWSDYYVKDAMRLHPLESKREGFHVYSSSRALEMALSVDGAVKHHDHAAKPRLNLGSRGPLHRKCYYYCGFMETGLLIIDGIHPSDFRGILSLS